MGRDMGKWYGSMGKGIGRGDIDKWDVSMGNANECMGKENESMGG